MFFAPSWYFSFPKELYHSRIMLKKEDHGRQWATNLKHEFQKRDIFFSLFFSRKIQNHAQTENFNKKSKVSASSRISIRMWRHEETKKNRKKYRILCKRGKRMCQWRGIRCVSPLSPREHPIVRSWGWFGMHGLGSRRGHCLNPLSENFSLFSFWAETWAEFLQQIFSRYDWSERRM